MGVIRSIISTFTFRKETTFPPITFWKDDYHRLAICCMSEEHVKSELDFIRMFEYSERIEESEFKRLHDGNIYEVITVADDNIMDVLYKVSREELAGNEFDQSE